MTRKLAAAAALAVLVSLFVWSGARGVDFGTHWDEVEWHLQPVQQMVATGIFLPHAYIYPSLSKWLVLLPSVPGALAEGLATGGDPASIQATMKAAVDAPDYLLSARLVFIVVSALAVVWTYGAARAFRRSVPEALAAACGLGLSWEYAYHARWVANDCILTQFAALTLFMLALFHLERRPRWLYLAAVAAGLGTGAKSPGVLLLVSVLVASVAARPTRDVKRQLGRLAALCLTAFAAYLVTSPGTLLEPFTFLKDSHRISAAYQGTHFGYTVSGPWQHWRLVATYFALSYFSPFRLVALIAFACALAGGVFWARANRAVAALLVGFPLLFLAFFCRYHIMIVRNSLLLAPFVSLLAARGGAEAIARIPRPLLRQALAAACAVVAVVQAIWLVRAGEGIRHFDLNAYARQAVAYVADHPGTTFRVSEGVRALAVEQGLALSPNVVAAPEGRAVVFLERAENRPPRERKTNDPFLTEAVFGPREVNINWYSTWESRDRVVVMTMEEARSAGISLAR